MIRFVSATSLMALLVPVLYLPSAYPPQLLPRRMILVKKFRTNLQSDDLNHVFLFLKTW